MKTILYTSTLIPDEAHRARLTHHVTRILSRGFNLDIRGNFPGCETLFVQTGQDGGYALWSISDNGGEFNVEKVNLRETLRSIPYTSSRFGIVDAGTVAYRIAMVIRGKPIDWKATFPDLVDDFGSTE
jgi:hypothetical protein